MKAKNLIVLGAFLLLVFVVEYVASRFTLSSVASWYPTLVKPSWTPPSWVFGPVWTLLYTLMAVALFLVWKAGGSVLAYFFWGLQLFFNLIWSLLFFQWQSPFWGMIDLAFLVGTLLVTLILFIRISFWAGFLLVPYFLWVSYALALNVAIWTLN